MSQYDTFYDDESIELHYTPPPKIGDLLKVSTKIGDTVVTTEYEFNESGEWVEV